MKLLISLFLIITALLDYGQAHHCSTACPSASPTVIVPKATTTYVYSLETKTILTPRDSQKVTVKADAEVSIVSNCEAVLHLKNVAIEGVPNAEELATELSAKPFAFTYHDGRINGVCPATDDQDWAVNVKKSIVSALQFQSIEDQMKMDEVDFSGRCPTDYRKINNVDGVVIVEKKKDLNLCDERRIDLRQTADQALGQLKELIRHYSHPMDSDLNCRYKIKDQVVSEVDCEERHTLLYRPHKPIHISNVKLSLKETKDGIAEDLGQTSSEPKQPYLSFEHNHKNPTEADVVEVLKKLCSEITDDTISIESAGSFQKLVNKLRYLSDEETTNVYEAVKASICPAAQKRIQELFLDASAFASSDGSIKTLVKAHENQELSITRSTALFLVVALKAAPKADTIQSLLPVIQSDKTIRPLLLGFSVLVRRYCEKTGDCANNPGMKEARDAYMSRLANSKTVNDKLTILKALENLNVYTEGSDAVVSSLEGIINDKDAEPVLRASAVQALPNDPSHMDRYKGILMDESNPNEARVAAFRKYAQNGGLEKIKDTFDAKGECIKNYIMTYVNNIQKSRNSVRKEQLKGDVELPNTPEYKIGITKNIARDYGPFTFEYDIIYPAHENSTRSINARVTRSAKGQVKDLLELQLYQKGFNKEVNNLINMIDRKSLGSGIQFVKDLMTMVMKMTKNPDDKHSLKFMVKINGKNVLVSDIFEDVHDMMEMLRKRFEKLTDEKKADRTIGAVLLDTKLVVPTITGFPLLYKLSNSMIVHYNGEATGEKGNRNIKMNRALIAAIHGGAKLKIKDNKMGYEYDGKLAYTPHLDMDIVKEDKRLLLRLNLKDVDQKTILKFKQSLREKRSTGEEKDYGENELSTPEGRSDKCVSFFLMDYCRKANKVQGLMIPNLEYYVVKPEKEVTALELEFKQEQEDKTRRYIAQLTAVGSPSNRQARAMIEVIKGEDYTISIKSPEHEVEMKFKLEADKNHLNMKMNLPNVIDAELTGEFDHDKETGIRKNKLHLDYKLPNDDQRYQVDHESEMLFRLKRSPKEKKSNVMYKAKYTSTHFPCTNHKVALQFQYRPLVSNEILLEWAHGKDFQHRYQVERKSNMEVEEMKPFKMHGNSEMKLVATDFDVDYDLQSDFKYESNKGTPIELKYNLKGKDRSKRAVEKGQEDIEGMVDYHNNGSPIDSKMNANMKIWGNQYSYESELKQVEPQQYEGKITLTKNDKKIFVTHKDEVTKPTDTFHVKSEAEVTYSDNSDKKNYFLEFKKEKDVYTFKSNVKKNGNMFYENDVTMLKNGKLNWNYHRNNKNWNLDVDNVFNPKEAHMDLKVHDREYKFKMMREPWRYHDISVEGNDKAYVKKGNLHMSLVNPMNISIVTQADGHIDATLDLLNPVHKRGTLRIDSKKYDLLHDGSLDVSLLGPRVSWKQFTKKDGKEYRVDADLAPRGSMVHWQRINEDGISNVKYVRSGDEVEMDLDTTLVEGKLDGNIWGGHYRLKGRQSDFELEGDYKYQDGNVVFETTKAENAKLEGLFSRKQANHFALETPKVKLHMDYDRHAPVKMFKLHFDGPSYEKNIDAEYEHGKRYSYHTKGLYKKSGKGYDIAFNGVPQKAFHLEADAMDFKLKVNKPEDSNKAQFSYTFNDYTETEEYDFDPNKAYYVNWINAIRAYIQQFIVEEH